MLQVQGLSRRFGGVYAVQDVNLEVAAGELRGVIGPNGAGKSTLFHLIAGHLEPSAGCVSLGGEPLDGLRADQRARRGIAIVHQRDRIFRRMTVRENVMVGAHGNAKHGFLEAALRLPRCRDENRALKAQADAALERVGLEKQADQAAESLALGQQRTMQLARALVANPKLLLLDEPAAGLRPPERAQLARLIREARAQGQTVLLIEHDVALVTSLSDVITVLDLGRVIAEGEPDMVRRNPQVLAAYLGEAPPP